MMQRSLSCPVFIHEIEKHLQGFSVATLGGEFRYSGHLYQKRNNHKNNLHGQGQQGFSQLNLVLCPNPFFPVWLLLQAGAPFRLIEAGVGQSWRM